MSPIGLVVGFLVCASIAEVTPDCQGWNISKKANPNELIKLGFAVKVTICANHKREV